MEEKILVQGVFGKNKQCRDLIISAVLCGILTIVSFVISFVLSKPIYGDEIIPSTTRAIGLTKNIVGYKPNIVWLIIAFLFLIATSIDMIRARLSYRNKSNMKLTITNKQVIGEINKQVINLPISQISSLQTGKLESLVLQASNKSITFYFLKNKEKITDVLSSMINQTSTYSTQTVSGSHIDCSEELIKYKNLLDNRVITQEEFDIKKKQLLGL